MWYNDISIAIRIQMNLSNIKFSVTVIAIFSLGLNVTFIVFPTRHGC